MLPISFDTQGWRLNLSPASLRSGRLLLTLGPEALRAQRGPFMLARRRDDRSLVSCFLEEA